MEHILSYIFSLPHVVTYMIFGALFGGVGGYLGKLLSKRIKSKTVSQAVWIFFLMFFIQLSTICVRSLEREVVVNKIVNELNENRLFALIIKLHPEAKKEIKDKFEELIKSNPSSDKMYYESQKIGAEFVNKYFQQSLLNASNHAIYEQVKYDVKMLTLFKNKPSICVSYFLGNPNFGKDDLSQDMIDKVSDLKSDIIESSVSNPSFLSDAGSSEVITNLLLSAYKAKGYSSESLQKINQIGLLKPEEGCEIALKFDSALEFLGEEKSAYVYKSMIVLSRQNLKN